MTVKELDELIPIDYVHTPDFGSVKYNSGYARDKYGNRKISSIEIDWENHDIDVWIEKEDGE